MVRTTRATPDKRQRSIAGERGAHDTLTAGPISEEDRAFRKALMERMLARRNEQESLDIPGDQLIREARDEAYDADES